MRTEEIIRNLKYTIKKHSNDRLFTGQTNISAMCEDILPKMEELKVYEDAEEQGLLIKLPCEIGTKVYRLIYGGIRRGWYYIPIEFDLNDLKLFERGLLAFTKEAAEQKLASMQKGE